MEFPFQLDESALKRVRHVLGRQGKTVLRIGVKGGGCSGYEYVMRPEDAARATDLVLEIEPGVTLVCDPRSAPILQGTVISYTGNLIGGGFQFENPNAARSCGCGTSFSLVGK